VPPEFVIVVLVVSSWLISYVLCVAPASRVPHVVSGFSRT